MQTIHRPINVQLLLLCALLLGVLFLAACPEEDPITGSSLIFEPVEFGTYEFDGQPRIEGPDRLFFGDVEVGQRVQRVATIRNVGRLALKFHEWTISAPFELEFPHFADGYPIELAPGASLTAVVSYTGQDNDGVQGTLSIMSNDEQNPRFDIGLFANLSLPCLVLEPAQRVDFGRTDRDATALRSVVATNCSPNSPTTFTVESLEGASEFYLMGERTPLRREIELNPGESIAIELAFAPRAPGDYQAELQISTSDAFSPERVIQLHGSGTPFGCPTAVIEAFHAQRGRVVADPNGTFEVVPLDRIQLSAAQSRDSDGEIVRVEWVLIERPEDTVVHFSQPGDSVNNGLYMELAGRYVVELHVWNARNTRSCQPARMVLEAVANKQFHIQLVWDTPNDQDRFDGSGTDLDLHLLHPRGRWNKGPHDCFWQNMRPDWGVAGDSSDDPSLDIDKVDGWGPENINLDKPENDTVYKVGVHYFSDHGYGASFATVRIFLGGELVSEVRRKRLADQQFWHMANIEWPAGRVVPIDATHATFP
ncbi:MAG: choice-of-anchor D domain-containing protein [Bradymonadaceae bacterium]|nr:choice-of-anchor D domain-containing protein [Lujinxingiaceae bacterium]